MSGVFIQPSEFLIFAAAGAAGAAVYTVFWLLRHFFKPGGFFETLSDFTFAVLSTAIFLLCLTGLTDGTLRFFYFAAYLLTFSASLILLNTFKDALIAFVKSAISRIAQSALFVNLSKLTKKLKEKAAEREKEKNERYAELKKLRGEKAAEKEKKRKEKNERNAESEKRRRKKKTKEKKKKRTQQKRYDSPRKNSALKINPK